jgi:hypothetical protein
LARGLLFKNRFVCILALSNFLSLNILALTNHLVKSEMKTVHSPKPEWRQAAEFILGGSVADSDIIHVFAPSHSYPLRYYLPRLNFNRKILRFHKRNVSSLHKVLRRVSATDVYVVFRQDELHQELLTKLSQGDSKKKVSIIVEANFGQLKIIQLGL